MPVTALSTVSARPGNAPAAQPQPTASASAIAVAPTINSRVSGAAVSTCESTSDPSRVVPNGCDHDGGASRPASIDRSEPSPGATSGPISATRDDDPEQGDADTCALVPRRRVRAGASSLAQSVRSRRLGAPGAAGYARQVIESESQLRDVIGSPSALVAGKVADRLNDLTRQFIERSPFLCIATAEPDGGLDVSPRGDPAGFVRILDERTLLLPDRPGNRIADTLTNLLADDRVALLFLIPGVGDSFRVNGRAAVTDDEELLAASTVDGKAPKLGILVDDRGGLHAVLEGAASAPTSGTPRSTSTGTSCRAAARSCARSATRSSIPTQYDRERAERYARREGFY